MPEQSMQKIVWTETAVEGPKKFDGKLPQPATVAGFYRDITVLAFPSAGEYRIADMQCKALGFHRSHVPLLRTICLTLLPRAAQKFRRNRRSIAAESPILATLMGKDGHLAWDVPKGRWTLMRDRPHVHRRE